MDLCNENNHAQLVNTKSESTQILEIKAILQDVRGEEKFYFSLFSSYIYVMTLVVTVL